MSSTIATCSSYSRDLNGIAPGVDIPEPVDEDRQRAAAKPLGIDVEEVRRLYVRLNTDHELPIQLA